MLELLLPHLGMMRGWASHVAADAMVAAQEGDANRLEGDITALLGMAEQVRKPETAISELVSYAIAGLACEQLNVVIEAKPELLTDEQLRNLAHRLSALELTPSRFDGVLDAERRFFLDVLQRTYSDDGNGQGRVTMAAIKAASKVHDGVVSVERQASLSKRSLAAMLGPITSMVVISRKEALAEYDHVLADIRLGARQPLWVFQGSPAIVELERRTGANTLTALRYLPLRMLVPALDRMVTSFHLAGQRRDATLVVIGAHLYKRSTGVWPGKAEDLSPRYLPEVVLDRFDGKPLRVTSRAGVLRVYSVGTNRVDDGGVTPKNNADASGWRTGNPGSSHWAGAVPDGDWIIFPPSEREKKDGQ